MTGTIGLSSPTTARQIALGAVALTALTVLGALRPHKGAGDSARRVPPDWQRRFNRIGAVQSVLIPALVVLLVVTGHPQLIPSVVCLVVGLHFLPLTRVFGQPQFAWTGSLLCLVAVAGLSLLLAGHPRGAVGLVGLGAATVLWVTSVHIARHKRLARAPDRPEGDSD